MPARVRADAHRQEHVAELRDRRVREHPLDVVLHQADRAGQERRRDADDRDDRQRLRRVAEQHRVAADHVHAGRHHRRRVDERGDRRRAFHRVRQPDVQRNLRRLAGRADEQQQRDRARPCRTPSPGASDAAGARDLLEVERAERARTASSTPRRNPKSPIRLTMNAFLPASDADFF